MLRRPELRGDLHRTVAHDPHLLELCEAYDEACIAADYWAGSTAFAAPQRAEEYRALVQEIEQDILRTLS